MNTEVNSRFSLLRRAVALLVLSALCAFPVATLPGCSSPPASVSASAVEPYVQTVMSKSNVPVSDMDVRSSTEFKRQLADIVDMYSQYYPAAYLSYVHLKSSLTIHGKSCRGLYWHKSAHIELEFNHSTEREIIETLYHEIGHAIFRGMPAAWIKRWEDMYFRRMQNYTLTMHGGPDMRMPFGMNRPGGFPSTHARLNSSEYFAEHFRVYCVSGAQHEHLDQEVHSMMVECLGDIARGSSD